MKTIWKFVVRLSEEPTFISMPKVSDIKHVDVQGEDICFWAEVNPTSRKVTRTFKVHATGHPVDPYEEYLGSAQMPPFVWHVYEVLS